MLLHYRYKKFSAVFVTILMLIGGYKAMANTTSLTTVKSETSCTNIEGVIGRNPQYKSGWIELKNPRSFRPDDKIKLEIGGDANRILVRFLHRDGDPNSLSSSNWQVASIPPANRKIEVIIDGKYPDIEQISVHGGADPFGMGFNFPENNGDATLLKAWECK